MGRTGDAPLGIYVAALILWILLLGYAPLLWSFYNRRHLHPIKGRMPRIIVLMCGFFFIYATVVTILTLWGPNASCGLFVWGVFIPALMGIHLYQYRLLHLLFNYEITENLMQLRTNGSAEWKENWFTKNRRLIQNPFSTKLALGLGAGYLLFIVILTAASEDIRSTHGCQTGAGALYANVFFPLALIFNLGFIGFLGFKIRSKHADAFSIKAEFLVTLNSAGLAILGYIIVQILASTQEDFQYTGLEGIFTLLALHVVIGSSIAWPYYLSLKEEKLIEERPTEAVNIRRLSVFLSFPKGFEAFLEYLKLEFCPENLLFWSEVQQFMRKTVDDPEAVKALAMEIFDKYIKEGSPFQITVSHNIYLQLQTDIRQLNPDAMDQTALRIFDKANQETFTMLELGSFPRFVHTESFQAVKKEIEKESKGRNSSQGPGEEVGRPSYSKSSKRRPFVKEASFKITRQETYEAAEQLAQGVLNINHWKAAVDREKEESTVEIQVDEPSRGEKDRGTREISPSPKDDEDFYA